MKPLPLKYGRRMTRRIRRLKRAAERRERSRLLALKLGPPMTSERRELAIAAVRANESRKDEDIDAWAHRLAASALGSDAP